MSHGVCIIPQVSIKLSVGTGYFLAMDIRAIDNNSESFPFSVLQSLQVGCGRLRMQSQVCGCAGTVHQPAVDAAPEPLSLFCYHDPAKLFILAGI